MLDEVAIYLVLSPVVLTGLMLAFVVFWLARRRDQSEPVRVSRRRRIDS